jgi:hypothetical protein
MTPDRFEQLLAKSIAVMLSVCGIVAGCYYIYCGIEFVLNN